MLLTEFLLPQHIHYNVVASCKKRALEMAGKLLAEALNQQLGEVVSTVTCEDGECCPNDCFSQLVKREKLGNTGLNNGVALPHAKLQGVPLDKPLAVFLRLENAIDYEASDHKYVDLIYAVIFPESCCESYKGRLQQIAQALSDKTLIKQLRAAESADEIWQLFEYADKQHSEQI